MITVTQCAALAGLASSEMVLGVTPSAKHHSLLASYLLNLGRGLVAVRTMIVSDLRSFLDLGASRRAADLLIVLRFFLSKHPEAGCIPLRPERRTVVTNSFLSQHLHQSQTRIQPQSRGNRTLFQRVLARELRMW